MKRFSVFLAAILITLIGSQSCIAQSRIFKEAAAIKGVTSIYVSPMLLKFGTGINDMDLGHGLDEAVSEIKGFELITCDEKIEVGKVKAICDEIIFKLGCELLMEINERDDNVKIYGTPIDGTTFVSQIILEVYDESNYDYTMIYIKGKIDLSKLDIDQ